MNLNQIILVYGGLVVLCVIVLTVYLVMLLIRFERTMKYVEESVGLVNRIVNNVSNKVENVSRIMEVLGYITTGMDAVGAKIKGKARPPLIKIASLLAGIKKGIQYILSKEVEK